MHSRLLPSDRALVRIPSWLGDAVTAEPALRALWERHAEAGFAGRVSLAGPARLLALFDGRFEGARRIPSAGRRGDLACDWRGHDFALLLTGSFRSAWCAWRARIPRRAGWARDGRGLLLTHAARPARERGGVPIGLGIPGRWPRHLPRPFGASCIELAGLAGVAVRDTRPRLEPTAPGLLAADTRLGRLGLAPDEPFVLANVGARPGSAKAYPPDLWARALDDLHRQTSLPILLACGPGEETALEAVRASLGSARAYSCTEPTAGLPELVALCARASLLVTTDSGPRHVAVATGTPVAVAAGPTDPRHTADHLRSTRLVRTPVPCGPCHREHCPLHGDLYHACMRGIAPERLAAAAADLLR